MQKLGKEIIIVPLFSAVIYQLVNRFFEKKYPKNDTIRELLEEVKKWKK